MRKYLDANIEYNTLNMPKETWLKLRKNGIGGSDASSILNLNPYRSSVNVYMDKIDDRYEGLDEADKKSVWYKPTEKAKEYRAYEREMREKMYSEIAERCGEYDRKQKNKDMER